jgi:5-hydroxyisourate hydrolase-like protein (transthyretin family)
MPSLRPLLLFLSFALTLSFTHGVGHAQTPERKIAPTGSISGRVTVTGKPAAGVNVLAYEMTNRRLPAAQSKTDSEGYYQLTGLAAASYQIATFTPNLTPADTASDPYGMAYLGASKGVLLAAGEQVTEIDLKLVRGGVITGKVLDAENRPVIEERVSLQKIEEPNVRPSQQSPLLALISQTDDRGVYRLYGLSAGRYKVSVGRNEAQSFIGPSNGFFPLTFHPDTTDASRAVVVDLAEGGEATNIDIRVGRRQDTYTVTGRVVDSATGVPVSGARMGVIVSRGREYAQNSMALATGADGKFSITGLNAGRYGIYVATDWGEAEFYSDPIYVEVSDKDVSDVEIRAVRGLSVSGTIVSESMDLKGLLTRVAGLRVSASVMPPDGRTTATSLRSFGSSKIAADGSFQITGLRPGRVMLNLGSADPLKRVSIVKVAVGGVGVSQGFEIEAGQSVTGVQLVVTYGTGVLRGNVTFLGGVVPDFRTEVICRREGTGLFAGGALMDSRGRFQMTGVAAGTYDCALQFIKPGGWAAQRPPQSQHQSVTVSDDAESEISFVVDLTPKGIGP